ncbi:MAG: diaminopimelate decarboxylase, partial [Bacteroidaceae bacterium]|nr:diaminopimelate decarboxylase [Bacteroidaceae bacterium]
MMNFPIDRFQTLRTPFYYYDTALLKQTLDVVSAQLARHEGYRMHYAVKANANPVLLRMISAQGFGADCVSGG